MPTIAPGGILKLSVVDQQALAVALRHVLELDDAVAQALGHRDEDLLRLVALLVSYERTAPRSAPARLALGLPRLRIGAHPLELLLHGLDARDFLLGLDLQALLLLLEPGAVVALPGDAVAAVELEDPLGGVVEEVAVVGHRHHGARESVCRNCSSQSTLSASRWLVGSSSSSMSGLDSSSWHSADAALLAAGQVGDLRVPGRQAQRVGGDLELVLGVAARGSEDRLVLGLLGGELVEVGVGLGVGGVDLVELLLGFEDLAQAVLDLLAHGLARDRAAAPAAGSRCCMFGIGTASPSMSLSTPAMILSRLDLPEPFRPSTPILAPGKNDREMSLRI